MRALANVRNDYLGACAAAFSASTSCLSLDRAVGLSLHCIARSPMHSGGGCYSETFVWRRDEDTAPNHCGQMWSSRDGPRPRSIGVNCWPHVCTLAPVSNRSSANGLKRFQRRLVESGLTAGRPCFADWMGLCANRSTAFFCGAIADIQGARRLCRNGGQERRAASHGGSLYPAVPGLAVNRRFFTCTGAWIYASGESSRHPRSRAHIALLNGSDSEEKAMSKVLYEKRDDIAIISLNAPPVNAIGGELVDELIDHLVTASNDNEVGAVIVASAIDGRFCAGLDLGGTLAASSEEIHTLLTRLYVELFDVQASLGKPSIAAIGGSTRGGGMTIAMSCDLIIASERANFGYPEIDLGLLPAIHYAHLSRLLGRQRAFELLFTGRTFTADEAERLGLILRAVSHESLSQTCMSIAQQFSAKPREAMRLGRSAFYTTLDHGYRRDVAFAAETFCTAARTQTAQSKMRAFVTGRGRARTEDPDAR
jgi:enoyl-CoA hydratase